MKAKGGGARKPIISEKESGGKRQVRGTAYHEAGHAVITVVEMDRLRQHLIMRAIDQVGELEVEEKFSENLRPDFPERLRKARRELSAVRRGQCVSAVTIRPRKGVLGCAYCPVLLPLLAIEQWDKNDRPVIFAIVASLLAGEIVEMEFTGSSVPHGADHDNEQALNMLLRLSSSNATNAEWGRLWAIPTARVRKLIRQPNVRRAVHAFAKALLREKRISGRHAEEMIRAALYCKGSRI